MDSLESATQLEFHELRRELDQRLEEAMNAVVKLSGGGTGSEPIDSRVDEIAHKAIQDFNDYRDMPDRAQQIEFGSRALADIAKGLSDLRPLVVEEVLQDTGARLLLDKILVQGERITESEQAWRRSQEVFVAVRSAKRSAAEAATAASATRTAAGEAGATRLETAFVKYANGQRESAQLFRVWTIILLVAVAVLGAAAAVLPAFGSPQAEVHWEAVVYRISVLGALAGLAAYLGRQSGQHRRAAVWADAIAVQLQAFPAFIQPITDQKVADQLYEAFGKRVMGSPPDFAGKSDDTVSPTMTALIDALVKQSRPAS